MLKFKLATLSLILLSACASSPILLQNTSHTPKQTSLLLNYSLSNPAQPEWTDTCSITLRKVDSNTEYQAPLKPQVKSLLISVPPGDYRIERLFCNKGGNWPLENFGAARVIASPGRINYLGNFNFQISKNKNTFEFLEDHGSRESTLQAFRDTLSTLDKQQKQQLVSAYNEKPIDAQWIENKINYRRGIVSHTKGKDVPLASPELTPCDTAENKTNPVLLGFLSYQAVYEGDHLIELNPASHMNTFSDTYVACIEKSLRLFKPGISKKVKYDINL